MKDQLIYMRIEVFFPHLITQNIKLCVKMQCRLIRLHTGLFDHQYQWK